ncbi:MAG: hypothetical protein FWD16_07520 [Clostridia bacterium]|nr:hypothetical protein [Clostridia bacterium]
MTNELFINEEQAPEKKRRAGMWLGIIAGGLVAVTAITLLLFWLFRPGVRAPFDLGIEATLNDYQSALAKLGIIANEAPQEGEPHNWNMSYGQPHPVDCKLTSEELTALFTFNRPEFEPVTNLQIKLGNNGMLEISGTVNRDWVLSDVLLGMYTQGELEGGMGVGLLPKNMNFYAEINGRVVEDAPALSIQKTNIHGFDLSRYLISEDEEAVGMIDEALEAYWAAVAATTGLSLDLCEAQDGQLAIKGEVPATMEWAKK